MWDAHSMDTGQTVCGSSSSSWSPKHDVKCWYRTNVLDTPRSLEDISDIGLHVCPETDPQISLTDGTIPISESFKSLKRFYPFNFCHCVYHLKGQSVWQFTKSQASRWGLALAQMASAGKTLGPNWQLFWLNCVHKIHDRWTDRRTLQDVSPIEGRGDVSPNTLDVNLVHLKWYIKG